MARKSTSKRDASAWWQQPEDDAYKLAWQWVQQARTGLRPWYDKSIAWMELYAGTADISGTGMNISGVDGKLRYNLTSAVVDTAVSIVGSSRTLPYFLTRGGDWSAQRRAKRCTTTLQSQFSTLNLFSHGSRVINDGIVTSLGALAFFADPETDQPGVERILPLELSFDTVEAMGGDIRTLARSKPVNRDVAKLLYPKHATALDISKGPDVYNRSDFAIQRDSQADQVVLHEIWRLPSKKGAKDGRHIIFADNVTLFSEQWTRPRFPIAFYRWSPRQLGFLGKSLVEEAEPAQRRVEHIIRYVEECQNLGSKPQVWLEAGCQVEPEQIDNLPMTVNRYAGTAPQFFTFDATPHDMEASVDTIRERLLSQLGLNSSQISGDKPSGVTSAIALQTVEDVSSRRHVMNVRQVEAFYMQCAACLRDVNDDIAADKAGYEISSRVRSRFLESIKWTEVAPADDEFEMCVYPTSSLPPTPAGQLDRIQDWISTGFVPQDVGMMLLGLPDTQAYTDEATADREYISWQIERLSDGKRVAPNQYADLSLAADLVRRHMLLAEMDGAPENVMNQFRFYLASAKNTIQKATQATQPVAPAAGQPPPDPAMAPQAQAMLPPGAGPIVPV